MNNSRAAHEAFLKAQYHEKKHDHHRDMATHLRDHGTGDLPKHHDTAADYHFEAAHHYRKAHVLYTKKIRDSANSHMESGAHWENKAKDHKFRHNIHESKIDEAKDDELAKKHQNLEPGRHVKYGAHTVMVVHHHSNGIHSTVLSGGRHMSVERKHLKPLEENINEALVARVAGVAAKLAVGHQFGDVAQMSAEYAVNRGEQIIRDKLSSIKKGAKKLIGNRKEHVAEMVGSVERESNQEYGRSDGTQAGPDPRVQRELKNHGILYRAAQMKAGAESKKKPVKEETIDEINGKGSIDAIGKHHSARMNKSNPDSAYHVIMRNRASRLKNMRDHTGPNVPATQSSPGRKQMLKYAGEDSREAKRLKPTDAK